MKYFCRIFLLFSLSGVYSFAGNPAEVRIMTFNIRYNNPADSIYSWDQRRTMVLKVIRDAKPDIIGLQEVLKSQLDDLLKGLPGYKASGVGRDDGKNAGEFSPILYDTLHYTIRNGSVFWISKTPGIPGSISWNSACTRIITWVSLTCKNSDESLFVFNTHFDHISGEARENGARMLVAAIDSLCGDDPAIVTGDFNSTDTTRAYKILTSGKPVILTDTRKSGKKPPAVTTTFIGFPADLGKNEIIDFIFINTRLKAEDYNIITYNENGRYPSDHLPVLANLLIK